MIYTLRGVYPPVAQVLVVKTFIDLFTKESVWPFVLAEHFKRLGSVDLVLDKDRSLLMTVTCHHENLSVVYENKVEGSAVTERVSIYSNLKTHVVELVFDVSGISALLNAEIQNFDDRFKPLLEEFKLSGDWEVDVRDKLLIEQYGLNVTKARLTLVKK